MRARRAGVAVLTLAVLAGGCGQGNETLVGPTTTAKNQNTAKLIFFVPTVLPEGMTIPKATLFRGPTPNAEGWGAAIGVPDGRGFRDVIHAYISTITPEQLAEPATTIPEAEQVKLGRITARDYRNETLGSSVQWRDDGRNVAVLGAYDRGDQVLAAAKRLRVAPRGKTAESRFDGLPSGYRQIGAGGGGATGRRNDYVMQGVISQPTKTVSITVRTLPEGFKQPVIAFGHELHRRTIRGERASVGTSRVTANGATYTQTHVVWRERTDLEVSIQGVLSEAEAVAIAEGLEQRTEAQWRAELNVEDRA